ncbi:hypothetical protein ACVME9_005187 [Bradyrhizobium liaoningense]
MPPLAPSLGAQRLVRRSLRRRRKQTRIFPQRQLDCFVARTPRNDEEERACAKLHSRAPDAAQRPFDGALQSRGLCCCVAYRVAAADWQRPACAMNSSMRRCSLRSHRREPCWRPGKTTTTTPGRTAPWATSRRPNTPNATLLGRNGTGRCAMPRAPRPAPLLHRAPWAHIQPGLFPLLDEARGSDQPMPKPTQPPGALFSLAEMGSLRPSQNLKLSDGSSAEVSK